MATEKPFLEKLGSFYGELGLPEGIGKLFGLLLTAERPLTLDEMAVRLNEPVNKLEATLKALCSMGMVDTQDDRYAFSPNAWENRFQLGLKWIPELRQILRETLADTPAENTSARINLQSTIDYFDFVEQELKGMMMRWDRKKAA